MKTKNQETLLKHLEEKQGRGSPKRARSKPLIRHILPSDNHAFVGRIYDLSIIAYHFDSYEELVRHPDCKYAFHTNYDLTGLTRRVETLNLVGGLLWPNPLPKDFKSFPVSRYEWLMVAADVFLVRYVSVVDCVLLLVNTVYELGLAPHQCTIRILKKRVPDVVNVILEEMLADQGSLRAERNARIHHGAERGFSDDDQTFRIAALFEHRGNCMVGTDQYGRRINLERSFKEGLAELQRDFNRSTRQLVRQLDRLYDELGKEFESRFIPRIRSSTHGINRRRAQ